MCSLNDVRRQVTRCEQYLQSFMGASRSTAVTITGEKFANFFLANAPMPLKHRVWSAFMTHPKGIALDMIVAPGAPILWPEATARLTFFLNARIVAAEQSIRFMVDTGVVHLHEHPADDWLGEMSAHFVAERVLCHSVHACAILISPFSTGREQAIRAEIRTQLAAQGSTASETQASTCAIIASSSLALLSDSQRWHLIVDSAHELGSEQHAEWARWAKPLHAAGILQSVDLVAASDLAGTHPGFNVVHEMSKQSLLSEANVRDFARRLFQSRVNPDHIHYRPQGSVGHVVLLISRTSQKLLVLSRLARGRERKENITFIETPVAVVKHCALLGHNEFAVSVQQRLALTHQAPMVVLRGAVAAKMNLRDWISFLVALPVKRAVLIVFRPAEDTLTLDDYLTRARLPQRPQLTL
jgi:uncharacterized membrane protein